MPTHAIQFYTEAGNLLTYSLDGLSKVEDMVVTTENEWSETFSDYNHHQRWNYAPRFKVKLRIGIYTQEDLCLLATFAETARLGYKFAFAYNENLTASTLLIDDAGIEDTEITIRDADQLQVKHNYRMIADHGYFNAVDPPVESLEQNWPNYVSMGIFTVESIINHPVYTISPPLTKDFKAGSYIYHWRYFPSLLLLNDSFTLSHQEKGFHWAWDAEFLMQRPPDMSFPAW
jgi:hypothetical protein